MSIVFLEDSWDTYGIDHLWQWIHIDKFVSLRACTFAILCHILPYFAMIAASEPLLFKILSSYYCALQFFAGISKHWFPQITSTFFVGFSIFNKPSSYFFVPPWRHGNLKNASQGQRCVAARGPEHLGRRVFPWFLWENGLEIGWENDGKTWLIPFKVN